MPHKSYIFEQIISKLRKSEVLLARDKRWGMSAGAGFDDLIAHRPFWKASFKDHSFRRFAPAT